MTKVEQLEREVQKLSPAELAAFREWFRKYDSQEWDDQIDKDAREGKLDKLASESLAEHQAGRTQEL